MLSLLPPSACSSFTTGFQSDVVSGAVVATVADVLSAATGSASSSAAGCSFAASAAGSAFGLLSTAGDLPLFLKSTEVGGMQFSSLHAPNSR